MTALILMAHGSRSEPANEEVRTLARELARLGVADRVTAAFLEATTPTLPDAIGEQAAAGAQEIVVLPLFLNTGNHVRRDIPRLMDEARARYPRARLIQLDHIGASPHYGDFIARIARSSLAAMQVRPCTY